MRDKVTKEEVKAAIRENAERFNMSTFGAKTSCGTVYCIAGWALVLAGYKQVQRPDGMEFVDESGEWVSPSGAARRLLGLSGTGLFHLESWPFKFRTDYTEAKDNGVEAACLAIDYFMPDAE